MRYNINGREWKERAWKSKQTRNRRVRNYMYGERPDTPGEPMILTDNEQERVSYSSTVMLGKVENDDGDEDCYFDRIGL